MGRVAAEAVAEVDELVPDGPVVDMETLLETVDEADCEADWEVLTADEELCEEEI